MFFIVFGAILGLVLGGPLGLFIGAFAGYAAGQILRRSVIGGLRVVQSDLIDSTFAVMGAVCKADSVVTRDEIKAVEQIFRMLNLNEELREQAKSAFNRGKQPEFDLDAAVDRFARISRRRAPLIQLFLQLHHIMDEVIAGLAGIVEGLVGAFGSQLELDLADILGGLDTGTDSSDPLSGIMSGLEIRVVDSRRFTVDEQGTWPEGLYAVDLGLFEHRVEDLQAALPFRGGAAAAERLLPQQEGKRQLVPGGAAGGEAADAEADDGAEDAKRPNQVAHLREDRRRA